MNKILLIPIKSINIEVDKTWNMFRKELSKEVVESNTSISMATNRRYWGRIFSDSFLLYLGAPYTRGAYYKVIGEFDNNILRIKIGTNLNRPFFMSSLFLIASLISNVKQFSISLTSLILPVIIFLIYSIFEIINVNVYMKSEIKYWITLINNRQ